MLPVPKIVTFAMKSPLLKFVAWCREFMRRRCARFARVEGRPCEYVTVNGTPRWTSVDSACTVGQPITVASTFFGNPIETAPHRAAPAGASPEDVSAIYCLPGLVFSRM